MLALCWHKGKELKSKLNIQNSKLKIGAGLWPATEPDPAPPYRQPPGSPLRKNAEIGSTLAVVCYRVLQEITPSPNGEIVAVNMNDIHYIAAAEIIIVKFK